MSEHELQPEAVGQRFSLDRFRDPGVRIPAFALALSGIVAADSALLAESHGTNEQVAACVEQYCGYLSVNPPHLPQAEAPLAHHVRPQGVHTAAEKPSSPPSPRPAKPHRVEPHLPRPSALPALPGSLRPHIVLRPQLREPDPPPPDFSGLEGNDLSWPQCPNKGVLPAKATLRIIGLNEISRQDQTNPCLGPRKGQRQIELAWAKQGDPRDTTFYQFLTNPGPKATDWPTNNVDPAHRQSSNVYGECQGGNGLACNWQSGWNRTVTDITTRLQPAAQVVGLSLPKGTMIWKDVDGSQYFQQGSSPATKARARANNRAMLEGTIAATKAYGFESGIYSLERDWNDIVGHVSARSTLYSLPEWLPTHGESVAYACSLPALTGGGKRVLVQDQEKIGRDIYDHDTGC